MSRLATILEILHAYRPALINGLWVTTKLCLIIWSSGMTLGVFLGIAGARWNLAVGIPSRVFSFFLSGIPILIFLFWCHWPLQKMRGVVIDPFYTAATVFSLVNIFAVADQVRH